MCVTNDFPLFQQEQLLTLISKVGESVHERAGVQQGGEAELLLCLTGSQDSGSVHSFSTYLP